MPAQLNGSICLFQGMRVLTSQHVQWFRGLSATRGDWTAGICRATLEMSRAILPPDRTRFCKNQFTQSQLSAILGLMRYEGEPFARPKWNWVRAASRVRRRDGRVCPTPRRRTVSCDASMARAPIVRSSTSTP